MASITLKNIPDPLLKALRSAAERDRRSLNQQVIHLLDSALRGHAEPPVPRAVEAQLAAWRKLAGKWESDLEPTKEAEGLMARRTQGREVDL